MGKKNRLVQLLSISAAIALGNVTVAAAENTPNGNAKGYHSATTKRASNSRSSSLASKLINDILDNQSNLDAAFLRLDAEKIAQADDTQDQTQEIIQPAQQPIPETQELNPSGNPLSFPTEANEVEVDDKKPITLEQAIELSLKNNKQIEEARLVVERSQAALRQEKAALYPTLDLTSGLSYGDSLFLDGLAEQRINQSVDESVATFREGAADATPEQIQEQENLIRQDVENRFTDINSNSFNFRGALRLGYTIYNGGARGASIRSAEKQLNSDELDLERIVEEVRLETSSNYYDLQNGDAQVEIQQAAVEDAKQTLKDAQLLERAGLGTRFDVLRAEVELAQAQQRLTTAIANQNIARRGLAETLSVSHDTDLSTADAIEEAGTWNLELAETIVQAFKNRAELEQNLLQREIAQEQKTVALSSIRPELGANLDYALNDDFEDDFDISDNYTIGVDLQWRLFDGGAARSQAEQQERNTEIAETQFADQRNQIRFAVEQAFFQLESNQNNITTATKAVELAQESLRLARLRFQAGVGTQTDVIAAQTNLTTARGDLLGSITDYNQSYADLRRQVSNTPDNGLQDLP